MILEVLNSVRFSDEMTKAVTAYRWKYVTPMRGLPI